MMRTVHGMRIAHAARALAAGSAAPVPPLRVSITGGAGAIGYALLPRIASGQVFGADQPVILQLLELPQAQSALKGVVMELRDCAFPLLHGVVATDDPAAAFNDADAAFLVGSRPRTAGMERSDLMTANASIFSVQGKALNNAAKDTCRVLVVGNPANTNALIAASHCPRIPARQFTALTRLDHGRATSMLAARCNVPITDIAGLAIWGNHSSTQYPDIFNTTVRGVPALQHDAVTLDWVRDTWIPEVAQRGAAIIKARGASSAMSAAGAAIDHMRDWWLGTGASPVSMSVVSSGEYGTPKGIITSFPVTCSAGEWSIVPRYDIPDFSRERIDASCHELVQERDMTAAHMGAAL